MPELPEVEIVKRGLNQLTLNKKIVGGEVLLERTVAHPISVGDFLGGLQGKAIAGWHRRGKYLLAQLYKWDTKILKLTQLKENQDGWLGVHLRMTGQLLWVKPEESLHKHTRVRIFFGDRSSGSEGHPTHELRFVDQRTFGQMWRVPPATEISHIITGLKKLGPEPFSPEFCPEYLTKKFDKRHRAIKTALLDQTTIAGLGNIYADEALFLSGIRPTTLCKDLTETQIEQLHLAILKVLQNSIDAGGTTFSNFLNVKGVNGNYGGVAWVYNRAGQPCRICDTSLEKIKLAGRSTHFCPQCQEG
ncbi:MULTISPECIES: DNA-formamidopyrimidine glycosylase [Okeania]|uniref:Formamidopyrimidine-DNA glycosylase n=1 Tax=Okeania hirsuta TaxID=1458930 RepID=A0A3N6N8Q6_9CYAN|nr:MULTISPECIES: DNA-formamidopyrimidine glycosylase [Okeania]NES90714.1 DNA-formamidopyrimidine glycosylase [Okeania sp. SIO2B9]RQH07301.1 DNA-formamidopyrimidine glycosylase [Okeania hirsuta]RQH27459.1 DNA-formamidopyrimidine glycosylase [Okeania hirsuta]